MLFSRSKEAQGVFEEGSVHSYYTIPWECRLFKGSMCGPFFFGGTCLTVSCCIFPGHNSLEKNIAK
jgi:hypothetical protein